VLQLLHALDLLAVGAAVHDGSSTANVRHPEIGAGFGALPPAVVVHGRRGPNSNINGVYIRDFTWHGQIGPCYRGSGTLAPQPVFLYFEGEWRMGPSPEQGSVWAYSRSDASSPLLINAPWEVWDGQRVAQDPQLKVSDTSVIPSVLFLSFGAGGAGIPPALRAAEGMLLQQPGLWDGRPYYRHRTWEDVFLLCSVAEGQWRLGPLPLSSAYHGKPGSTARSASILFTRSASALPQEIIEPWHAMINETASPTMLGEGVVRIALTNTLVGASSTPRYHHPRHIVVEGVQAGNGAANGVYRRAPETLHQRPVYHKTDALRAASLWFAGGDWRLGPVADGGRVWTYAPSASLSPLTMRAAWQQFEGKEEEAIRITDANSTIPSAVIVAGERYVQQPRLCDARPVYQRDVQEPGAAEVFLFFRAHEVEWWLGPVVGGTECYAKATGSLLQVVPDAGSLVWRSAFPHTDHSSAAGTTKHEAEFSIGGSIDGAAALGVDGEELRAMASSLGALSPDARAWCGVALALALVFFGLKLLPNYDGRCGSAGGGLLHLIIGGVQDSPDAAVLQPSCCDDAPKKSLALACVVCLEAPREILLLPCRHVCCCRACADRMERCPMCRAQKTAFAKVFL